MAQLTEGQKMILDFQDAGYTDKMIGEIKKQRSQRAMDAGYSQSDIDAYWGDGPGVGTEVFTNIAKDNLNKVGWKYENLPMADPNNALDVFVASFGISTSGLRYRRPKEQLPPTSEMSWGASFANAGGTLIGDAGDMLLGLGGGLVGSAGNPVAAGSASMAYPEAIRRGYLYAYEKGNVSTANILEGMTKAPAEIAKAAIIGGVGGKTGQVAFNAVDKVASPLVASMSANIAGTLTSTGVGAGLNGEMPSIKDFTIAGAMMALLPGSHYSLANSLFRKVGARGRVVFSEAGERIKSNVQQVWAKTGVKPTDQSRIAEVDKIARQSIISKDVDGQVATDGAWDKWRQPEPEPYKSKAPEEVEIIGGMKPGGLKPVEEGAEQFTIAGKVNPDTGIAPVAKVTPEQVDALVDFDAPITPEQAEIVNNAAKKYKNEDGSVDLEAVLIEHSAGEAAAQVYRASGRDYSTLDPKTQRLLEYAGKRLEEDGYAPEPKAGAGGGGEGGEPPGGSPKALGGPPEKPFNRAFEFVVEDVNSKVEVSSVEGGWKGFLKRFFHSAPDAETVREGKAAWRELSPLAGVDKMIGIGQKIGQIGIETIARLQYSADDRFMFRVNKGGGGYKVTTDKFGNPKYEANYDVPTMQSILTRADKFEHGREGFRAYMQAQATLDIVNMNTAEANAVKAASAFDTTVRAAAIKTARTARKEKAAADKAKVAAKAAYKKAEAAAKDAGMDPAKRAKAEEAMREFMRKRADADAAAAKARSAREDMKSAIKGAKKSAAGVKAAKDKFAKKTTTTLEEAMEVIEKVPAKEKEAYRELAHHYQRMMDDSLFGVMSHGGLDDAGFFKFKLERPHYFPQKVYIEPKKATGGSRLKYLFKKAKGHDFQLKDQFLSTLEILQARERFNSATITRLNAVRKLQDHFKSPGKDIVLHDPKTKKPATLTLDDDGIPVVDKNFFDYKEGDPEIIYYEDGRKKSYTVPDFDGRDVFLKSLLSKNVFERDVAVTFFTKAAQFTRFTITTMPSYVYRMVVRDAFGHATLTKYGGAPYVNLMRGAFDIIDTAAHGKISGGKNLARGKAKFDEATLNGAVVGGLIAPQFDALLNSYTHMEHTGFMGGVINGLTHPAQFLYRGLRMMDATVRIGGTYTGVREKFGSLAAADAARTIGGDFAEKSLSTVMNQVASITPFWTGFQRAGVDAIVKSLKNDPTGFGLRGMKYMTTTAILFYALTEVLEDAYDVPEPSRQRNRDRKMADNFMYIPVPWNGELHNFALPVPQGIGAVFISPVHRIMSRLREKDPRAFKDWAYNVAFSFTGAAPGLDNPAINSVLESASNYDFGFGRPIVPARFENVSDYNAYQPWTSETAKSLSRWIGEPGLNVADVTPIMIEHVLETFTGTAGREAMRIMDAVVKDNKPPADWANTPFFGSFFLRHPGINAQPINDFYDELDKFRNLKGDVNAARKRRDRPALKEARAALREEANLTKTAEAMRNMRAIAYKIMDDKKMTPDDKRQAIDNIATKMIALSKSALGKIDRRRWKRRIKELEEK